MDDTKSINENLYLRMQVDGELEIINYKKDANGKGLFRVRWGGVSATNHSYTWEPASRLKLAVNTKGGSLLEDYIKNPVYVDA